VTSTAFGQPVGRICQAGYVVPDLSAAMSRYAELLDIGPWFVTGHFQPHVQLYRGEPTEVDVSIASAYSGALMVELIQQHDDSPSVFRDTIAARGYGFHHWALTTSAFATECDAYRARGYEAAFEVQLPDLFDGGRATYFDTSEDLPGMIELIELNEQVEGFFGTMKSAAETWDRTSLTAPLPAAA
jgi:hypothetical protein